MHHNMTLMYIMTYVCVCVCVCVARGDYTMPTPGKGFAKTREHEFQHCSPGLPLSNTTSTEMKMMMS